MNEPVTALRQAAQTLARQRRNDEAAAGLPRTVGAEEPPLALDYRAARTTLRSVRMNMNVVIGVAKKVGMPPSNVSLVWTHMIDAILEEGP